MNYMSVQSVAFQPRRPGFARGLDPCRGAAIVWLSLAAHLAAQATTIYIDAYDQPASNGSTTLEVVGSPGSYGAVSPPYGVTNGLETGDTLLLAPASGTGYTNLTDTFRVCCTGLVVSLVNPDSGLVTNTSPVITSFPYNYSHAGMARAEWLWRTENGIKVKVTTGGTVSTSLAWSADPAETLTITATPTAPAHFLRWIGDVPAELAENQTITLDFSQPRSVGAVFSTELAFHVATTGDDGTGTGSEAVPFASITYAI